MCHRVVSSIVAFLFASLSLASAQLNFTAASYDSGDSSTQSAVTGDFNNDGILDMVSINASSMSFYKGVGGGKYANAVTTTFSNYSGPAVAADFNRDGKLDLAVATYNPTGNQVLIYLGNGDGTFASFWGTPPTGNSFSSIALADFNGDHLPDLAISQCDSNGVCSVEVFLGQGDGTFHSSATLAYGGGQVVAGDFNADGHQDIAVLGDQASTSQLDIFLGNGNGTFQTPKVAKFSYPVSLAVGDFYNTKIQSLAILNYVFNGSGSTFYLTTARCLNGTLVIGTPQVVIANTLGNYMFITSGDLNGDFLDDIAVVGSGPVPNPAAAYMLGKGNGTFQNPVNLAAFGQNELDPLIRDLNFDSRHDLSGGWSDSDSRYGTGGGVFAMVNNSATTNCNPPPANKLGVKICAPSSGQTVSSTFTFKAAGNAFNGIAKRMELWIDGKKIGQNLEDQLKITTTLSAGRHTASFVVVDTFDNHTSSTVSFTAE